MHNTLSTAVSSIPFLLFNSCLQDRPLSAGLNQTYRGRRSLTGYRHTRALSVNKSKALRGTPLRGLLKPSCKSHRSSRARRSLVVEADQRSPQSNYFSMASSATFEIDSSAVVSDTIGDLPVYEPVTPPAGSVSAPDVGATPSKDMGNERGPRRMGTFGVVLTVFAYLSPLAGTVGFVPLVIGYGNGLGAPPMFLIAGVVLAVFAVGFLAMVRQHPRPGAFYAYISAGLGKRIGLGAGFMTAAYYILGGAGFYFFTAIAMQSMFRDNVGLELPWWIYLFISLAIVTFCSYRGTDFNVRIIGTIVCVEVLVVVIFNAATLIRGGPTGYPTESFTWEALTSGPPAIAALFSISLYAGFETTAVYREEVKNPTKTISRASYILIATLAIFYALTAWCIITAIGSATVVESSAFDPAGTVNNAFINSVGHGFAQLVSILLVTSALASQIAIANASSRYLYSFGMDRILPRSVGSLHKRHGSPHRAAIFNAAIVTVFILAYMMTRTSPTTVFAVSGGVVIFAFEALMLLVSIAVLVYFRRHPATGEPVWKVLIAPMASIACFAWLLCFTARRADLLLGTPTPMTPLLFSLIGLSFVAGVAYASWLAFRRPADFQRIGRDRS
jgi:amino acid transporter